MNLQELLTELQKVEFTDLVDLYLEAKIGKHATATDLLPVDTVELIYSLDEAIKEATEKNEP